MYTSSVICQKGESQNGGNKNTTHVKFSEKLTFFTPWYANSTCPANWALLYEALSLRLQRRTGVLKEIVLLFPPSTKILQKFFTFNFIPKINQFLSKIPPISHTFLLHERYRTFNMTVFMCEAKMYFQSFLKINSHLKIFLVICF